MKYYIVFEIKPKLIRLSKCYTATSSAQATKTQLEKVRLQMVEYYKNRLAENDYHDASLEAGVIPASWFRECDEESVKDYEERCYSIFEFDDATGLCVDPATGTKYTAEQARACPSYYSCAEDYEDPIQPIIRKNK